MYKLPKVKAKCWGSQRKSARARIILQNFPSLSKNNAADLAVPISIKLKSNIMETPKEDDIITNADESKRLPDENPEPLEGVKKEETGILDNEPEGKEEGGNVAAKDEADTRKLDGSNANNLRTK